MANALTRGVSPQTRHVLAAASALALLAGALLIHVPEALTMGLVVALIAFWAFVVVLSRPFVGLIGLTVCLTYAPNIPLLSTESLGGAAWTVKAGAFRIGGDDLFIASTFLGWLAYKLHQRGEIRLGPGRMVILVIAIWAVLLASALSATYIFGTTHGIVSALWACKWLEYALLSLIAYDTLSTPGQAKVLWNVFFCASALTATLAVILFFLRLNEIGLSGATLENMRVSLGTWNPNAFALLFLISIVLAFAQFGDKSNPFLARAWLWIGTALLLVGLFGTFSRTALFALPVGLAVVATHQGWRGMGRLLLAFSILVGVAGSIVWALFANAAYLVRRLEELELFFWYGIIPENLLYRTLPWEGLLEYFFDYPLIGIGFNVAVPDNVYLQLLVETGIMGASLMLYFWVIVIFFRIFKIAKATDDPWLRRLAQGYVGVMASMFVAGLVGNSFLVPRITGILLLLWGGITKAHALREGRIRAGSAAGEDWRTG